MLWGWDLEAVDWDRVTNACFVSEKGDVEHFEGPNAIVSAADFIDETGGTFGAHASGIYDTLLVSAARGEPWDEVVMSGGAVLCAKAGRTTLRDTFRAWLSGLKKVGEGLEKMEDRREAAGGERHAPKGTWLKKHVDRTRMRLLTDRERREYCESDTAIVTEAMKECRAWIESHGARNAWTAGGAAMHLLEALEPASWGVLQAFALDFETSLDASQVIRGARVETWALGRVDRVYCYDVKSAYPAAYAREDIGVGARRLRRGERAPGRVSRVRWCWPWRGTEDGLPSEIRVPPVLDQATGAGAGWCEAWVIDEERDELEKWVSVQEIEAWAPQAMVPIGQTFARVLYDEKEAGSFFAKCFFNSLAGKYAQSPILEAWTSGARPTDYYKIPPAMVGDYWRYLTASYDKRGKVRPNLQPLAAAHILGRARIRLWKYISALTRAGWEVYYCDTDSIHTNCPPDRMPFRLGKSLGMLAFEGGPYVCHYVGPKAYCAVNPTTGEVEKGACKGMPWASLADAERERHSLYGYTYRQARGDKPGADLRLAVFEDALREVGGARIVKEGIATWRQGLRRTAGWSRFEIVRTLEPHERGKLFHRKAGPTVWTYQTPAELLHGRGLALAKDPFAIVPKNPFEPDDEDDAQGDFFDAA